MNTPTAYSGIKACVWPPEITTRVAAMSPQRDDAHREREAVAAEANWRGKKPSIGEHGGQAREGGEGRVRGQEQQQGGERLER